MRPAVLATPTFLIGLCLLAGCASQSQWSPTVDTYGNSRAQYLSRDTEECRALARSASGDTGGQAAQGLAVGAMAGAAGGALFGAILGKPGTGAALGAAAGGIGGGAMSAGRTNEEFQRAFKNCMRQRGHNVIN